MLRYDVAVIGAGPAGSSAAIMLARAGARVLLLERGRFPRHKVCGEFVSAESLGLLNALLAPANPFTSALAITYTRLFIDGRAIAAAITPPAASIPRHDLDLALWNAAIANGANGRSACEVSDITHDGHVFTIRTATETFTAASVLDATGRWSRLRGDRVPAGPKWIGLKCHFKESPVPTQLQQLASVSTTPSSELGTELRTESVDLYFFELGYCGVQPVAPGLVNACAMVRSDGATTLSDVFALHPALGARAAHWTALFDEVTTAPLVFRDPQPLRHVPSASNATVPIFCLGDAAAFIDPFAGDGISLALRTGVAAAESLLPFVRGEQTLSAAANTYAQRYARDFAPILKSAARVRRLLDTPRALRAAALAAMRVPFVANYVIRKTRTV